MEKFKAIYRGYRDIVLKGRYFGYFLMAKIATYNALGIIGRDSFYKKKFNAIKRCLFSRYHDVIIKSEQTETKSIKISHKIIWIFWWQGVESMPKLCYACYKKLLSTNGKYKIICVSKHNYSEYINIPDYLINKVTNGVFSYTHLSDVIRVMLIAKYGGLWVDATLFFTDEIPEKWFDYDFFSIKNKMENSEYISRNRWSTFIMGSGYSNSPFWKKLESLMLEYTRRENIFIEYMTIDVFMDILFEMKEYNHLLESLPLQNESLHVLRGLLNSPFNLQYMKVLKKDNICFKLTYKMKFLEFKSQLPTFYNKIINDEI